MQRVLKILELPCKSRSHETFKLFLSPNSMILMLPQNYGFETQLRTRSQAPCFATIDSPSVMESLASCFAHRESNASRVLYESLSALRDELIQNIEDFDKVVSALEKKGNWLFIKYGVGFSSPFVELLQKLTSSPHFALEVFNWRRRNQENHDIPMIPEEYAKGIRIAGRNRDIDLAVDLFNEAASRFTTRKTSIYNALMGAYMYNGCADKCQSLFNDLKKEKNLRPSVATYNILISVFGRLILVNQMEEAFDELNMSELTPNSRTYNNLISGYVTAWMWDRMERTYQKMVGTSKPNLITYLLLLRGYAISGKIGEMEEMYNLVKGDIDNYRLPLIRSMICAYCRSCLPDRVKRIEELISHIPEEDYRPWLNVLLIRVYAKENLLEHMEKLIREAFEHQTIVTNTGIMKAISSAYYKCNAVDRLADFLKRAEHAGWRICRSLYHCKMILYGIENRLQEMGCVLSEMNSVNLNYTKKTLYILHLFYSNCGLRFQVARITGLMFKLGYDSIVTATVD